jgi:hypothetical protein
MSDVRSRTRKGLLLLVLAATAVWTTSVAAAASKNTVRINAPAKLVHGKQLQTTIHGVASGKLQLAYFAAYKKCAASALAESKLSIGSIYYHVSGAYSHRVLTPPLNRSGFLCAYLESGAVNGKGVPIGTVVAHVTKAFKTT